MVASMPRIRAASATAWAWFPDENATTPRVRAAPTSRANALNAPRNLNAPMRWKFSHLKNTLAPIASSAVREVMTGVTWAIPMSLPAAASTSAYVGCSGSAPRTLAKRRHAEQPDVRPADEECVQRKPEDDRYSIVEPARRRGFDRLRPALHGNAI